MKTHSSAQTTLFSIGTAIMLLAPATLPGAVVLDAFTDGDRTDGADALDVNWQRTGSGAATVESTTANGALANSDNALVMEPGTGTFRAIFAQFPDQTLAVGQAITLSFDFALRGTIGSNSAGFRFGLGNAGATTTYTDGSSGGRADDHGYRVTLATGTSGAATQIARDGDGTPDHGTLLGGSDGDTITGAGELDLVLNNTNVHSAFMSITRTGTTQMTIDTSIYDSAGLTGAIVGSASSVETQTDALYYTYNQVGMGNGSVTTDFTFDNVLIDTVPEPGTFTLSAGAALLLVFSRRRRRS